MKIRGKKRQTSVLFSGQARLTAGGQALRRATACTIAAMFASSLFLVSSSAQEDPSTLRPFGPSADLRAGYAQGRLSSGQAALSASPQNPVGVVVLADGEEKQIQTEAVSVAEVLARNRISLGELDRVTPGLEEKVSEGTRIVVVRVRREIIARRSESEPPTRARYDRRVGRPIVLHPGKAGLIAQQVKAYLKDGQVTQERVLTSRLVRRPVPRRVVIGRNLRRLPSRGGVPLMMVATAYDPGPRSCGKFASGRTAVGMKAGRGVVAVDPSVIPLGTRLYVEGYGEAVAGDVGSAIKGRRIDLGFDTYAEALRFGRRTVRVYILD